PEQRRDGGRVDLALDLPGGRVDLRQHTAVAVPAGDPDSPAVAAERECRDAGGARGRREIPGVAERRAAHIDAEEPHMRATCPAEDSIAAGNERARLEIGNPN